MDITRVRGQIPVCQNMVHHGHETIGTTPFKKHSLKGLPLTNFQTLAGAPASKKEAFMERRIIKPWTWQNQYGCAANEVSGVQRTLMCSGQTSVDADGNVLHSGDMARQINQALDNLESVLREAGFKMSDVVRLNIYTTDMELFWGAAEGAGRRLAESGCRVASTLLGIQLLAFPEMLVEIEATAVV